MMRSSFTPVLRRLYRSYPPRAVLVLAAAAIVVCASGAASAQSADQILKQATRALGGEKALKRVHGWSAKGAVTRTADGATGTILMVAAQPNTYAVRFDFGGVEDSVVYNGRSAWTRDSKEGLSTLTGAASRDFQAESAYRNSRWLNYKNDRARVAVAGQSVIEGTAVNQVTLTTSKNVVVRIYFDAKTGLPFRDEFPARGAVLITTYQDYRAVDGVMEPFHLRISEAGDEFDIQFAAVTHNGTVDPALFNFPHLTNEPLPDIPALLKQVTANEAHLDEVLENYGYTETTSEREFDDHGVLREKGSETHEWTFYKGNRIRRLTAKNGQPLSASDQANEDKRIEKQLRDLEKKETEKERKAAENDAGKSGDQGSSDDKDDRLSISDILRASELVNPRRELFHGRNVIVFDFEPLPGYKPQKEYEKFFGKTAGVIWIDDADRQVARLEAQLVDSFKIGGGLVASLKKGGSFVFEQQRVNNEIWLPTSIEVNFAAKVLLFKSLNANQLTTFGNYHHYNTSIKTTEINAPAEPAPKP